MGFPLSYGSHGLSDHSSEPWSFSWVVKSKICNGEDHLLGLNKARALDFKRLNKKIGLSIKCEMKDPCSSGCCAHEKLVENSYRKVQRKGKKCIPPKLSPSFQLFVLKFPEQHLTSFFKSPTSFFFLLLNYPVSFEHKQTLGIYNSLWQEITWMSSAFCLFTLFIFNVP